MIDEAFQSQFNISHTSCLNIFEQFTTTLSYQDRRIENGGQNKIYNEEEKEMICEQVIDNFGLQISEIINNKEINLKSACKSTIKNILNENDIYPFQQLSIIHLTESQKESRIAFCQRLNSQSFIKRQQFISNEGLLMGAIRNNGPLCLKRINGNLNFQGYMQILKEYFYEKGDVLPENFLFQYDNSSVHIGGFVNEYFEEKNINKLEQLSKSPDLSPFENLWSILKDELWAQRDQIITEEDIFEMAKQQLFNSERILETILNSYSSLNKRITAVIQSNGEQI
ncbi:hypothetical protein ABPG72_008924 [Tetrahymena utriculariae]